MQNEKIRCIIVDDEPHVSRVLEIELEENFPNIELIGIARNVKDAVALINQSKPDLVFLDIVMPEENGFALLNYFQKIDFELIFVTSYSEYALSAIKVSALAYLLKPINSQELGEALEVVKERRGMKEAFRNYQLLQENMKKEMSQDQILAIHHSGETAFVKIQDIICCEGWDRYTKIHILEKKFIVSSYSVGKYKNILEAYSFIHCHRSYLVNPNHIESLAGHEELRLKQNIKIPISVRKKHEIVNKLPHLKIL